MQHLHDDNHLDGLSRDAAERFETDPNLHSWDKLQSKLDAALPQKEKKKRRPFFLILFFFLLAGGGITISAILWKNNQVADSTPADAKPASAPSPSGGSTATGSHQTPPVTSGKPVTGNSQLADPIKPVNPEAGQATNPKAADAGPDNIKPATQLFSRERTDSRKQVIQKTVGKKPGIDKDSTEDNTSVTVAKGKQPQKAIQTTPADAVPGKQSATKEDVAIVQVDSTTLHDSTASVTRPDAIAEAVKKEDTATNVSSPSTEKKQKQDSPLRNRWEFGVVYAPDMSTVKFTHTQKPGSNAGLSIGYNISRRWSVQTGILYTARHYKSKGRDYHPPKGYWTDYVDLRTVTATCNMWDIPVNLRYNLAPRKSSNVFVSAGLSSYLMKKEDYDYDYYYNGSLISRSRSYETDNRHWFSVLNLSIAYERQLGRNLSLQAEPFFKQPLKGVGFGSVRLNTTGIFFSLKYKPLANKLAQHPKEKP